MSPWDHLVEGLIHGSGQFVEKVRRVMTGDVDEMRGLRRLKSHAEWPRIVQVVESLCSEPWEELCIRHGNWGRDLALWLRRHHGGMKLRELGERSGGMRYAAVSEAIRRIERRRLVEAVVDEAIRQAEEMLNV